MKLSTLNNSAMAMAFTFFSHAVTAVCFVPLGRQPNCTLFQTLHFSLFSNQFSSKSLPILIQIFTRGANGVKI